MSMDAMKVDSACCNLASTQYNGNYFFGRTWTVLFTCLYEHDMVGRGEHRRIVYQLRAVCTENVRIGGNCCLLKCI